MIIPLIQDLQIAEVQFHGIPNQERIAIYVHKYCSLGEYCLMLSMPSVEGVPLPVKDQMLWFGTGFVNPGDWIFVYTAAGNTTILPGQLTAGSTLQPRIISLHWGKDHTIFQNRALNPMLVKIGAVGGPPQPMPAYQGNLSNKPYGLLS